MLSADGIRRAILNRLDAMEASCNGTHLTHNDGVLRGLLWALTGVDPGTNLSGDVQKVFDLAGIPARTEDGMVIHALPGEADWPQEVR